MSGARRALVLALALTAAACTDFQDVSTVIDLRVLAVRTEPSEVILDDTDPATNLPIVVTPLIADPLVDDISKVTWTLVACPNNSYGAAPPATGMNMIAGGGARTTVGSNECPVGAATTWPLVPDDTGKITFTADQLKAAAMVDFYLDQFGNLHGGLDLGLPMNLQLTVTDGMQTAVAIKRILYWYTGPDLYWKAPLGNADRTDVQKPNLTPEIDYVHAYHERDDAAAPVPPVMTFDAAPADPLVVPVGDHLWIEPHVPDGTAEPYWTTVIDRDTHLAVPLHVDKERLRFAFYATAGKFDPPRSASELPPGFVGTPHLESKYQAPAKLDGLPTDASGRALVTVWITIRDERGGESWVIRQLAIAP